jgi:hypothetical protein
VERVEHREEAFAGNGEDSVAAVDLELVDKDLAAGALGHARPIATRNEIVISVACSSSPDGNNPMLCRRNLFGGLTQVMEIGL